MVAVAGGAVAAAGAAGTTGGWSVPNSMPISPDDANKSAPATAGSSFCTELNGVGVVVGMPEGDIVPGWVL